MFIGSFLNSLSFSNIEVKFRQGIGAKRLFEVLRDNPYGTPLFYNENIEFIALQALDQLSVFEVANVLLFKAACDVYGKDSVRIHFLTDKNGSFIESEIPHFISAASPLLKDGEERLTEALRAVKLPWHQFLFFSIPEDKSDISDLHRSILKVSMPFIQTVVDGEQRRCVMTPQLLDTFMKTLIKTEMVMNLTLGVSPVSDFEDFLKRPIAIPFSLTPPPKETHKVPTSHKECPSLAALNFMDHDYYHYLIDLLNPHIKMFNELAPVLKDIPYAQIESEDGSSAYSTYLDREIYHYRRSFFESGCIKNSLFWTVLTIVLVQFNEKVAEHSHKSSMENSMNKVVDYIYDNRERWRRDYAISLSDILYANFEAGEMKGVSIASFGRDLRNIVCARLYPPIINGSSFEAELDSYLYPTLSITNGPSFRGEFLRKNIRLFTESRPLMWNLFHIDTHTLSINKRPSFKAELVLYRNPTLSINKGPSFEEEFLRKNILLFTESCHLMRNFLQNNTHLFTESRHLMRNLFDIDTHTLPIDKDPLSE